MIASSVRKELFHSINSVADEIREGLRYGIPHLVGEINREGGETKVNIVVTVFENSRHRFLIKDGERVKFLFSLDDDNPHRIFMKLWMFLNGKSNESCIKPGATLRGSLYETLRKRRFQVIWASSQGGGDAEYTQVVAVRDGVRYNMLLEVVGNNMFRVVDVKET